jgi:diguanylate cyclase (GGDEF)-like protein
MTSMSPRQLARFTALLWAIGALLALSAIFLPHGPTVNVKGWSALAIYAAVVASTELLIGERFPAWPNYVTQLLALFGISAGVFYAHRSAVAFGVCSLYLLPTIFAASNYPTPLLGVYLVMQSAASAGVLLSSGVPGDLAGWMAVVGTTTTVGVVVHVQQQALRLAAITDPLTGLENRRGFEPMLARELARCERLGHPLCLAVLDLDRFKEVNDELGHQEGDRILVEMSNAWTNVLRPFDVLARAGGDEFVLLLPSTGPEQATEILARLTAASPQDFSAGVALAGPASRVEDMLRRADNACYEAKHRGRGQIVIAPNVEVGGAAQ